MAEKVYFRIVVLLLIIALFVTGCAPATPTEIVQEALVPTVTVQETAVPTETVQAAATSPGRIAPANLPPRGSPVTPAAPTTEPTAELITAPAQVAGNLALCILPGRAISHVFDYYQLGIPRSTAYVPSTGAVEVAVLFVDFSDARASTTPDAEFARLYLNETSAYYREVSYGKLDLVFKPYLTWLSLPENTASYAGRIGSNNASYETDISERAFLEEAVKAAGANVDFSNTDLVLLVVNPDATNAPGSDAPRIFSTSDHTQGIPAGGRTIPGGLIFGMTRTAQGGDVLLQNYLVGRMVGQTMSMIRHNMSDTTLYPNLTDEQRTSSTGSFSNLGSSNEKANAPGFFAFERWHLGWLDDGQILCQTDGEQTIELSAIGQPGGMKTIIVPVGDTTVLVVESRRATGVDQKLVKEGALVYTVDTSLTQGAAPIKTLPFPAPDNDLFRYQAPLAEGESLIYCNITITNVVKRSDGDTVRVTIPGVIDCSQDGTRPTTAAPTVTATPAPVVPAAGQAFDCRGPVPSPSQSDAMLRFVNESGVEAALYYQDASVSPPQEIEYYKVPQGGLYDQESYQNHKWIVREVGTGVTLLEYIASADMKQCVLIKPPLGTLWLDFVNNGNVPAIAYLVDASGNLQEYARIGVGATSGLWTASGDKWRVLDASGNLLLDYTSTSAAIQQAVIQRVLATKTPLPPTATPTLMATQDWCANISLPAASYEVRLNIVNETSGPIVVAWINFNGNLDQFSQQVPPGDFVYYDTWIGHQFAVLDANSNQITKVTVGNGPTQCERVR